MNVQNGDLLMWTKSRKTLLVGNSPNGQDVWVHDLYTVNAAGTHMGTPKSPDKWTITSDGIHAADRASGKCTVNTCGRMNKAKIAELVASGSLVLVKVN